MLLCIDRRSSYFLKLGLAVVDEQHRFGENKEQTLEEKYKHFDDSDPQFHGHWR